MENEGEKRGESERERKDKWNRKKRE